MLWSGKLYIVRVTVDVYAIRVWFGECSFGKKNVVPHFRHKRKLEALQLDRIKVTENVFVT